MKPIWMKKAKKYYDKSPKTFRGRVDRALEELIGIFPDVGKSPNVKMMLGTDDIYRRAKSVASSGETLFRSLTSCSRIRVTVAPMGAHCIVSAGMSSTVGGW